MNEALFYALKVRLTARGERDLRTIRLIGGYASWDKACDGAVRACLANRLEEDAGQYRYLVRCRASVPETLLSRSEARRGGWTSRQRGEGGER